MTDALAGNLYIADTYNCVIREVSAATGIINTVAGTGTCNFSGDGPAIQNNLDLPSGVWSDANGNLFIADTNNHRIRWVDLSGNMTTVAGDREPGATPATADRLLFNAELYYPGSGSGAGRRGRYSRRRSVQFPSAQNLRIRRARYLHRQSGFRHRAGGIDRHPAGADTECGRAPDHPELSRSAATFTEADDCGSSLANGKSCGIYIYFKPKAGGTRTGTLMIEDNGYLPGDFSTVNSTWTGIGVAISVTGGPLSLPTNWRRPPVPPQTITVTNVGSSAITMERYFA